MKLDLNNIDQNTAIIVEQIHQNGGNCYLVGGTVRDYYLQNKVSENKKIDLDIEVHNLEFEQLQLLIMDLGFTYHIQGNFGVLKVEEALAEFAIPRSENQIGYKHQDFQVNLNPYMDLKEAAKRRDFTCNALYYNLSNNTVIDNYGGLADINTRILRHVSDKFKEDGLRVYRAIRFSSTLGMDIARETVNLCLQMQTELSHISVDRKNQELDKYFNGQYLNTTTNYFIELIITNELNISKHNNLNKINFSPDYTADKLSLYYPAFITYLDLNESQVQALLTQTLSNKRKQVLIKKMLKKGDFANCINNKELIFNFIETWIKDADLITEYNKALNTVCVAKLPDLFALYQNLDKKYNGQYFIDRAYQGREIGIKRREKIREGFIKHL